MNRVYMSISFKRHLMVWYGLLVNTPIYRGSLIGWIFGLFGQRGVTINGVIHLTNKAPDLNSTEGIILIGHELYHVEQQREMGWWRFLTSYIWHWRPKHIGRGYEHPLEIEAYIRSSDIRKRLLRGHK